MISFITFNSVSISLNFIVISKIYSELTIFKYISSCIRLPIPPYFEPSLPPYSSLIFYADLPIFSVARLASLSLCIFLFVCCVGSLFIYLSIYLYHIYLFIKFIHFQLIIIWICWNMSSSKTWKYAVVSGCKLISSSHWQVPLKFISVNYFSSFGNIMIYWMCGWCWSVHPQRRTFHFFECVLVVKIV